MDARERHPLFGKTTAALSVAGVLLALPYAHPRLSGWRIGTALETGPAAVAPGPAPTVGETTLRASENKGTVTNALPTKPTVAEPLDPAVLAKLAGSLAIEDPTGRALDAF